MEASNNAELDSQLFSTLCEIDKNNYLYLFERCKQHNVNARQLRYLEKEHVRELVPKIQVGILAEFEYLLNEWKIKNGYCSPKALAAATKKIETSSKYVQTDKVTSQQASTNVNINSHEYSQSSTPKFQTQKSSKQATPASSFLISDDTQLLRVLNYGDESIMSESEMTNDTQTMDQMSYDPFLDNYPLEAVIPHALKMIIPNYEVTKSLTERDRRTLSGAIVDFFHSKRIKLRPDIINSLADQIIKLFPTERKETWFEKRHNRYRGRLYMRMYNTNRTRDSLRKKIKLMRDDMAGGADSANQQDDENSNDGSVLDDLDLLEVTEEGQRIQDWLKLHKCEDFTEIKGLWEDSLNFRRLQLKALKKEIEAVKEYLSKWPCYSLSRGHELLSIDFERCMPDKIRMFQTKWLVFKQKIPSLYEAELKDSTCLDLFARFQARKDRLNEDSIEAILIFLLHAITKPFRIFKTETGNIRYSIKDSQYSVIRLAPDTEELGKYNETHPVIYCVGESFLEVTDCYVLFLDIRYKLSFIDCLATCFRIYSVFNLDDPCPSVHFWQFIRFFLFGVQRPNETAYAVMENVVHYLNTAVVPISISSSVQFEN